MKREGIEYSKQIPELCEWYTGETNDQLDVVGEVEESGMLLRVQLRCLNAW